MEPQSETHNDIPDIRSNSGSEGTSGLVDEISNTAELELKDAPETDHKTLPKATNLDRDTNAARPQQGTELTVDAFPTEKGKTTIASNVSLSISTCSTTRRERFSHLYHQFEIYPNPLSPNWIAIVEHTTTDEFTEVQDKAVVKVYRLKFHPAGLVQQIDDLEITLTDELFSDQQVVSFCWLGPEAFAIGGENGIELFYLEEEPPASRTDSRRGSLSGSNASFHGGDGDCNGASECPPSSCGSQENMAWSRHMLSTRPCLSVASSYSQDDFILACGYYLEDCTLSSRDHSDNIADFGLSIYKGEIASISNLSEEMVTYKGYRNTTVSKLGFFAQRRNVLMLKKDDDNSVIFHFIKSDTNTLNKDKHNITLDGGLCLSCRRSTSADPNKTQQILGFSLGSREVVAVWGKDWVRVQVIHMEASEGNEMTVIASEVLPLQFSHQFSGGEDVVIEDVSIASSFSKNTHLFRDVVAVNGPHGAEVFELGRVPGTGRILYKDGEPSMTIGNGRCLLQGTMDRDVNIGKDCDSFYVKRVHFIPRSTYLSDITNIDKEGFATTVAPELVVLPAPSTLADTVALRPCLATISSSEGIAFHKACLRPPVAAMSRTGGLAISGTVSSGAQPSILLNSPHWNEPRKVSLRYGDLRKSVLAPIDPKTSQTWLSRLSMLNRWFKLGYGLDSSRNKEIVTGELTGVPIRKPDLSSEGKAHLRELTEMLSGWTAINYMELLFRPRKVVEASAGLNSKGGANLMPAFMSRSSSSPGPLTLGHQGVIGQGGSLHSKKYVDISYLGILPLWRRSFGRRWIGRVFNSATGLGENEMPDKKKMTRLLAKEMGRVIRKGRLLEYHELGCRLGTSARPGSAHSYNAQPEGLRPPNTAQPEMRVIGLAMVGWLWQVPPNLVQGQDVPPGISRSRFKLQLWTQQICTEMAKQGRQGQAVVMAFFLVGPQLVVSLIGHILSSVDPAAERDSKTQWKSLLGLMRKLCNEYRGPNSYQVKPKEASEGRSTAFSSVFSNFLSEGEKKWCEDQRVEYMSRQSAGAATPTDIHILLILRVLAGENIQSVLLDHANSPFECRMTVRMLVALALLLLSDTELNQFLTQLEAHCVLHGSLSGLYLTGLTDRGVELLSKYSRRTGDVMSSTLFLIRAAGRYVKVHDPKAIDLIGRSGPDEGGPVWSHLRPALEAGEWILWMSTLDEWLHCWGGWIERAMWGKMAERVRKGNRLVGTPESEVGNVAHPGGPGGGSANSSFRRHPAAPMSGSRTSHRVEAGSTFDSSIYSPGMGGSGSQPVRPSAIVLRCIQCLRPVTVPSLAGPAGPGGLGGGSTRPGMGPSQGSSDSAVGQHSNGSVCPRCGTNVARCCLCLTSIGEEVSDGEEWPEDEPDAPSRPQSRQQQDGEGAEWDEAQQQQQPVYHQRHSPSPSVNTGRQHQHEEGSSANVRGSERPSGLAALSRNPSVNSFGPTEGSSRRVLSSGSGAFSERGGDGRSTPTAGLVLRPQSPPGSLAGGSPYPGQPASPGAGAGAGAIPFSVGPDEERRARPRPARSPPGSASAGQGQAGRARTRARLVQFCIKCHHVMHEKHAREWFRSQIFCPVPDCDCACGVCS